MSEFSQWTEELAHILSHTVFTTKTGDVLEDSKGPERLLSIAHHMMKTGGRIFFIGNGASASMASHIAADMGKNGKLKTDVFTDLALLTAVVNDLGGDQVFAAPLDTQSHPGDTLVIISSSGASPNLLRAIEVAQTKPLHIITFTAMSPDNPIRTSGDVNIWVPADTYGFAESAHAALLHYWVDSVIAHFTEKSLL